MVQFLIQTAQHGYTLVYMLRSDFEGITVAVNSTAGVPFV
jgi:hypothetical protein